MAGLLGDIFSAGNVAKRKLTDLLGNPILSAQQMLGNLNDRARVLNEMTTAAAREGVSYGPSSQQLAGLLSEAYNPVGLTVFHGSPAKFQKFDPTKIGSGEGAQAYGYGHYVAESPAVAREYQEKLSSTGGAKRIASKFPKIDDAIKEAQRKVTHYENLIESGGNNVPLDRANHFLQMSKKDLQDLQDMKAGLPENTGAFYKIDLPDEQIAKMLDWDKPLSQQPEIVKSIIPQSLGLTYKKLENGNHAFVNSEGQIIGNLQKGGTQESFTKNWTEDVLRGTGSDLYRQLGQGMEGGPKVSSALRQAGIPGIRYLDQGSRGTGQGTSNFVVFPGNEDLLRILERNNEVIAPTGLLDYRIKHRPMTVEGGASRLHDAGTVFGEDVYGKNALQYFGSGLSGEKTSLDILKKVRGNPDAEITIYRGVPEGVNAINKGDWVTLDPKMAEEYGNVIKKKVKARDITTWPDSLVEFGYYPD